MHVVLMTAVVIAAVLLFVRRRASLGPKKVVIRNPTLGFLNLLGDDGQRWLAEDKGSFGALFASVEERAAEPPSCDVLFLYCSINDNGSIHGTPSSLREIIHQARAPIVVVASPNTVEAYTAAGKKSNFGAANLVMTLERSSGSFGRFFQALFKDMQAGTPMPVAWVRLAPQGPRGGGQDTPGAIFACELGQVAFK